MLQECNSVEAIKNAVKCNLGVAFVSKLAVQKEIDTGQLHALTVKDIPLMRSLRCVVDPVRYQSRAVRAFVDQMFGQIAESPKELPVQLQEKVSTYNFVVQAQSVSCHVDQSSFSVDLGCCCLAVYTHVKMLLRLCMLSRGCVECNQQLKLTFICASLGCH